MKLLNNWVNVLFSLALLTGASSAPAVEKVVYFHNDALGSPVAATNEQGQLLWTETYEPYGKRVVNPASDNKLWYTGKPEDAEFGLNYFGARWYDPLVGRFQGIDPVDFQEGNVQSCNRYAYANNNPYTYVDPDGRNPALAALVVVAWVGGGAVTAGAMNAAIQYHDTGTVQWGGIGGVFDAAGDGAMFGPLGVIGTAETGTISGAMRAGVPKGANKAPDFVVSPGGTAFPVPKGATGPTPVVNPAGNQTGVAFTGGAGGANGQVSTMRIMNPTPARGNSPGYPNGYIKYENSASPKPQGVDPYSGKTLPNSQSHFSID